MIFNLIMKADIKQLKINFIKAKKIFTKNKLKNFCVTITTNTSQNSRKVYQTPIRIIRKTLIFGVVVYSTEQIKSVCHIFDKTIDAIFVDTEKKIPFLIGKKFKKNFHPRQLNMIYKKEKLSNEFVELGNLSTTVKANTEYTLIHEFKPNDITTEHVWLLLRSFLGVFTRKKIAIIGAGNIGFKLGLKLVESGANVTLNRRDLTKSMIFANAINVIKPNATLANADFSQDKLKACFSANAIIGCTNTSNSISLEMLKCMKPKGIVIDVGKGNISSKAVNYAKKHNIQILRCDITTTLTSYIDFYINFFKKINPAGRKKIDKNISIISGGYIGKKGDVIVDNILNPSQILGIADGSGNFQKINSKLKKAKINKIKLKLKL